MPPTKLPRLSSTRRVESSNNLHSHSSYAPLNNLQLLGNFQMPTSTAQNNRYAEADDSQSDSVSSYLDSDDDLSSILSGPTTQKPTNNPPSNLNNSKKILNITPSARSPSPTTPIGPPSPEMARKYSHSPVNRSNILTMSMS